MTSNEFIIKHQAKTFYEKEYFEDVLNSYLPVQNPLYFKQSLGLRLKDFSTSESKSIFLNEVYKIVSEDFEKAKQSGNNSSVQAEIDISFATTLFFVNQYIDEYPSFVKSSESSNEINSRDSVFISYSHSDISYINDFKRHLKDLERTHGVELWDDGKIAVGEKWEDQIKSAMGRAKVAIFVVSADFFGSNFIANQELPELLRKAEEEGAKIISIIVKPCDFLGSVLSQYQALNSPHKTVLGMSELEKEELWLSLLLAIKKSFNI